MRQQTSTTDQSVSLNKKETIASWYRSRLHRLTGLIHRFQRDHHRRNRTEPIEESYVDDNGVALTQINPLVQGNQSVRIKHVLASSIKHQNFEPIYPVREVNLSESEQSSLYSRY